MNSCTALELTGTLCCGRFEPTSGAAALAAAFVRAGRPREAIEADFNVVRSPARFGRENPNAASLWARPNCRARAPMCFAFGKLCPCVTRSPFAGNHVCVCGCVCVCACVRACVRLCVCLVRRVCVPRGLSAPKPCVCACLVPSLSLWKTKGRRHSPLSP